METAPPAAEPGVVASAHGSGRLSTARGRRTERGRMGAGSRRAIPTAIAPSVAGGDVPRGRITHEIRNCVAPRHPSGPHRRVVPPEPLLARAPRVAEQARRCDEDAQLTRG